MPRRFLSLAAMTLAAVASPRGESRLVTSGTDEARRFAAVARFGSCTAFLIRPPGGGADAPAYVVTAGHCIDLGTNTVIVNREDPRQAAVFHYRHDVSAAGRLSANSRRIVYSTMKRLDLAVVELDATPGALAAAGIEPLMLDADAAAAGDPAEWAGIPSSGIPPGEAFLRRSPCTIQGFADVVEWRWLWWDMLRHDCSEILGGASGSPLLSLRTGRVVGIVSTGNTGQLETSGDFPCWRDAPCETGPRGFVFRPEASYAVPVTALAGCFDAGGRFSLEAAGCGLDPGLQAGVTETAIAVPPGGSWNTRVRSEMLTRFRYKAVREGEGDCRDPQGYGAPLALAGEARITDPLPAAPGRYHLCVIAGEQPARFASIVHVRVDITPPGLKPEFQLWPANGGFLFIPSLRPPELAAQLVKVDGGTGSGCGVREGYREVYPVPLRVEAGAVRLCILTRDLAGNEAGPYEIPLRGPAIFPGGVLSAASQEQGRAAPGAWISIHGVNLTARAFVTGARGARQPLEVAYATPGQVNARLPAEIPPGAATVTVVAEDGREAAAPLAIEQAAPGIFTPNGVRYGAAAVFALGEEGALEPGFRCDAYQRCELLPLTEPRLLLFAGGLPARVAAGDLRVTLAGRALEALAVSPASAAGVVTVTVRIPEDVRLSGYLTLRLAWRESVSPPVFVWLRQP